MKVYDILTKNTLESNNKMVMESWKALPDRFTTKLPHDSDSVPKEYKSSKNKQDDTASAISG